MKIGISLLTALLLSALAVWTASPAAAAPVTVTPDFRFTPAAPLSLVPVTFTSTTIVTPPGTPVSQAWDLDDDGIFETPGVKATRSFPSKGSYRIALRVTDLKGRIFNVAKPVKVENRPPVASIAQSPSAPEVGDHVTFFSTSTDADGTIKAQTWDLDADGKFDDGKATVAARDFDAPGTYPVLLKVVDNNDRSSIATAVVTVSERGSPGVVVLQGPTPATQLMTPFPIVRISGTFSRKGIRLRLLSIQAPRGARIDLLCRGRGCPFHRRRRTVSSGSPLTRTLRFRQFRHRMLRAGATLRVLVGDRSAIGKYTRFRVRRSRPPVRLDRCLPPGTRRPAACPSF